jgi:hypothetical protein
MTHLPPLDATIPVASSDAGDVEMVAKLLRRDFDIRTIQLLLGHRSLQTPFIYTQVHQTVSHITSPLDRL